VPDVRPPLWKTVTRGAILAGATYIVAVAESMHVGGRSNCVNRRSNCLAFLRFRDAAKRCWLARKPSCAVLIKDVR